MNSPRVALIALLIAVEVVIAGMILYALHGPRHSLFAAGMHSSAFTPAVVMPLAAGFSPHVYISDRDSGVTVNTSTDGLVHVVDETNVSGTMWGTPIAQLKVSRSDDGVRIERPDNDSDVSVFGFLRRHIEVSVPAHATIEIARCSGADVSNVQNDVTVASQDGHVALTGVRGNVSAQSDDGSIRLNDVTANLLDARTDDGTIRAAGIAIAGTSPHALFHSKDGSVEVNGAFAPGGSYEVSSNDGHVSIGIAPGADMTIDASTGDGHIVVDGHRYDEDGPQTVRLGSGSATMRVATDDGSVHISTNGAI